MKKNSSPFFFFLLLSLLSFGFYSCQETETEPDQTDPRDKYLGLWSVNEQWTKLTYEVYITAISGSSTGIYIENFAASGSGVKTRAVVSGNYVEISPLPQTLSNGWIITSGSGSFSGSTKMNWDYVFDDQANTYTATAVFTKK